MLKTLIMDLPLVMPLRCYGICFESVTELEVHVAGGLFERLKHIFLKTAKMFGFTRVISKLFKVEIINNLECSLLMNQLGELDQ